MADETKHVTSNVVQGSTNAASSVAEGTKSAASNVIEESKNIASSGVEKSGQAWEGITRCDGIQIQRIIQLENTR